jgi:tetratricopeptide (TPR) repeat protein
VSSYKNYLIASTLLFSLTACTNVEVTTPNNKVHTNKTVLENIKQFELEDEYIMYALEYESQKKYNSSREIYLKLFEKTNRYEYLTNYLNLSFLLKDYRSVKKYASSNLIENIKEEELILKLYTLSLLKLNEKEETIKYAKKLVNKFYHKSNHTLLASIYLDLKEYEKSEEEFEEAYKIDNSIETLQTIANIQYFHTNQKEKSKNTMREYIEKNSYPFNLSLQLLSFYEKDKEKDKIVPLLEKMYFNYKDKKEASLYKTQDLLTRYLVKENSEKAIIFLEENNIESATLLELYKNANQLDKAILLLDKLYKKTGKLEYLGQQAIVEFEMAKNKEMVLDSVISKFDMVLNKISNPIYENYLAYILIDYDLDISRGLTLVKKALILEPNNLAFIDTLAWGEYKNKDCKNAYINMKKVVDSAGLEDKEIKLHWEKIKECTK